LAPPGAEPGRSLMVLVRVADVAVAAAAGLLLAALVRRLAQLRAPHQDEAADGVRDEARPWDHVWLGPAAAAWYAALYLHTGYWCLAQAEAWANPFALGAVLVLLAQGAKGREDRSRPVLPYAHTPIPLLAAGLLAGCAALLKFSAILP